MVDDADTVDMPAGAMCLDPCYLWLEAMMDDAEMDTDDEDEVVFVFEFEGDDLDED
jgi:hypothetical protein